MNEPKITVKGKILTIEVDLSDEGKESKSGKSIVISSTNGSKKVHTDQGDFSVGLNVFKKK